MAVAMSIDGPVGVDLGGTYTRVAVFTRPGSAERVQVARFLTDPDYDRQLAALIAAIRAAGVAPTSLGVSFGGRVDPTGTSVTVALNLRGYEGRALRHDLELALSCPVRIAHDATCGLLGEHGHGSLEGADRCGYVTLSTGTGCALRLGRGRHFVAMTTEAGHQLVLGNDLRCPCGQLGCLETLTGGRALEQRLGKPLAEVEDERFWDSYAQSLAHGLANFALVAGLDAVALGGSIIQRRPEIWTSLRASLATHLTYHPLAVFPAHLAEDAPVVGAAVLLATPEHSILH
jgi:glucokinase